MHQITDRAVVSASVESILTERPKLFRTSDGIFGVAALGVLMTYRDFIHLTCLNLSGTNIGANVASMFIKAHTIQEYTEIKALYRGVGVPSAYEDDFRIDPFGAATEAVRDIFKRIRERADKSQEIVRMLTDVEYDYAEACNPA